MLDEREATYRSEVSSNFFNFMTVMIIISYILYKLSSGLSVLSISLCTALVFCVIMYVRMLYTIALPTRAMLTMLNVLGKCDVLGEAMQPFVHHQRDGVVKIKYREELRSRYAKFVYCNHNRVVRECHVSRCRDCEPRS